MAQLTPEQAAARMKMRARLAANAPPEQDLSWWDNLKNEASGMGEGMWEAAKDPGGALMGMLGLGVGAGEAGLRYVAPGVGESFDRFNNAVADWSGNTLAKPRPVGEKTPIANAATDVAKGMYNSFAHPIDSIQEKPISTTLDWLSAVGGVVGKVPGLVEKVGALKSAEEVLRRSKTAFEDAKTAAYAHPNRINTSEIRDAATRAASDAGYDPNRTLYAGDKPAVEAVSRQFPNEGSVRDVHDMRRSVNIRDARPTVTGLSEDSGVAAAMKQAIDSKLEEVDPEAFSLLKKVFDLHRNYKNTEAILDVRNAGERVGNLSPSAAKAVGREVNKAVSDKATVRGLGEESAADLAHVNDMLKPASLRETLYTKGVQHLPTASAALGFATPMGPAGALIGFAGGGLLKHLLTAAKDAKTAKRMSEELLELTHKINNIPRDPGSRGVGMVKLTPGQRALMGLIPTLTER